MTLIASFVFDLLAFAPRVHAAGYTLNVPLGGQGTITGGPAEYISTLYTFSLGLGAFLAMTMIIVGAVRYTIAAGNSSQQGDAKDQITNAVYGLILLFGAYLVLQILNPKLVELKNPDVSPIEGPQPATSPSSGNINLSINGSDCSLRWTVTGLQGFNRMMILSSSDPQVPVGSSLWTTVSINDGRYSLIPANPLRGPNTFAQGRINFRVVAQAGDGQLSDPSAAHNTLSIRPSIPRITSFYRPPLYPNTYIILLSGPLPLCNFTGVAAEFATASSGPWSEVSVAQLTNVVSGSYNALEFPVSSGGIPPRGFVRVRYNYASSPQPIYSQSFQYARIP